MAIQQQGTGYRDPAKSLSIKALQARSKAAAEAATQSMQMPTQISDPWQGAAHISGVLGSSINRGRAEAEEGAGRARLAEIVAGIDPVAGPTQQQQAEIRMLDEDFANKIYEDAMETRRQEDQQKHALDLQTGQQTFTAGESEKTREATSEENELNRQADVARQKLADANAAGRQDDAQAATEELARLNAQLDETKARTAQTIKEEAIPAETARRETEADRLGLIKGSPERNEFVLTGQYPSKPASTNVYNQGDQPAFDKETDTLAAKRLDETVKSGAEAQSFIGQLRIIADLGKEIGTGKEEYIVQTLAPYAEMVGLDLDVFSNLGEGQAYKAIVDKLAPNMRVAGAGPSSDFDARQFLSSLPELGRSPEGNQIINDTFEAVAQHKMAAADLAARAQSKEITWQEAEKQIRALPNPYDNFKKMRGGGTSTETPEGDAAPTMQPGDEEGDTGTSTGPNGEVINWIVQGGAWVRQ